ncbi:helix-turn-helix domain-containing protein [Halomonas sp. McH1-25]|uniref:helix-turn-helix domain-containing protein n=1 Tax=unclassified Halomonas TaxID=2609666 RepID=UPI001EF4B81A|nr:MULTISPECIES: helix-turn-helix domain-containing protein [unclassified Halomonas]MCG7598224.1 helix-turn-helix domain-containing protein [Halomonas sp. McH1-25]MCP1340993.1 helix-turn-helix domain-containing protein [Halomonas sp. FL8]MCP1363142.1 helix-turn-helix domain-containing protein [Halomonas sp. BBD45]MCP1365228.1 helix-turn-helix domain-containing protein [Halomonas sp. BBD48]
MALPALRRISTRDVPREQRLAYWESSACETIVGLRCSSFAEAGLDAEQLNLKTPGLGLSDIRGNEHVIERTPELVRRNAKDSVFACLLLESEAFFYQGNRCVNVSPGELIVYDTDIPYLYGFVHPMRQLLVDLPKACLQGLPETALASPIKIAPVSGSERLLLRTFRQRLLEALTRPAADNGNALHGDMRELLQLMLMNERRPASSLDTAYLLLAGQYIEDHLHEPELDGARIAAAAGISLRHLNRLFARREQSVARLIMTKRLDRVHRMLGDEKCRHMSIAEIAYSWGFLSQAHFSRAYRARFGMTARETRQMRLDNACHPGPATA